MTNYIILDDDIKEVARIKKIIKDVEVNAIIKYFPKVNKEFREEIMSFDKRKVYILDIELGTKVSGINAARLIRENDYESEIIFITSHEKMFESVHRSIYEVFDFIEKFHNFEIRLKKDLKIIASRDYGLKLFKFNVNNVELSVFYNRILYIYRETLERKVVIVTDTNIYKVNLGINEILERLDARFRRCHRSCIFNRDRVEEKNYRKGYFKLDTGKEVYMLSKKYQNSLSI